MIRVDVGENFMLTVALWDDALDDNASGRIVYYDIRDDGDGYLSPPEAGILPESTVTSGIYLKEISIDTPGDYVYYTTCSGFFSNSGEIIVNSENIYELVKQNRHYNISVEEVIRENVSVTPSQLARNVGMDKTDYIITRIKSNSDVDWDGTVVSGTVYSWYRSTADSLPYMMADDGL